MTAEDIREACAKVCDEWRNDGRTVGGRTAGYLAEQIRALDLTQFASPDARDAARLDFYSCHPHDVSYADGYRGDIGAWYWRGRDRNMYEAPDLRAAIDAAIAAGEGEG